MTARIALFLGALSLYSTRIAAQEQPRMAEGRVLRAAESRSAQPVPGQWVVLHRVGSDRAGPLDSARSGAGGRFRFRYTASGAPDALYFVSATYAGIAYFSPPLRAEVVRGGDADIMVYDTTNDTTALRVQGRHLVVSLPRGPRREIAEIFEIENQGARTVVARDSIPVWTTILPAEAESVSVAPGDVSAGAVAFSPGRAALFAPLSPGVRQLVLTYSLPARSFPVSIPIQRATSVLEVLMEDPRGEVIGAGLTEVAPAPIEGRIFRRFLAQDAVPSAVIRVNAPAPARENRAALRILLAVIAIAMVAALMVAILKRRRTTLHVGGVTSNVQRPTSNAERLVAELAAMDARHERRPPATDAERANHERDRAELKARLAAALAAENPRV